MGPGPPIDLARENRIRELFEEVLELDERARPGLLERRREEDSGLVREVEVMLHHHDAMGSFLASPLAAIRDDAETPSALAGSVERLLGSYTGATPGRAGPRAGLSPGDVVGGYRIEGVLGRGGSGEVYRAQQLSLGERDVALKVLSSESIDDEERRRFEREARAAAGIHHPHLVDAFDFFEDEPRRVLAYSMRLVEGRTLRELHLELAYRGEPPRGRLLRLVVERLLEAARGVAALHANGLVHRDVKPGNVLVENADGADPWNGLAVVVDFGLVRSVDPEQTFSAVWATPAYASPERLDGRPVDARSDVYSLGLCLHDLLSARLPHERRRLSPAELEPLSRLVPDVPRDLEAIVDRALDPEIGRRYPDARALAADLEAFLADLPVSARPLRGLERARRWIRRHPARVLSWVARGTAGVLVALALVAGTLYVLGVERSVAEVRAGWARGDLIGVDDALGRVPSLLDFRFGGDVGADVSALRSSAPGSPLVRVRDLLRTDRDEDAFLLAACFLERDGPSAHPGLTRLLAGTLARETGTGLAYRIRLIARLFFERPDAAPGDVGASASIRRELLRLLEDEEVGPSDRLYVVTALAGCGDPGVVGPVCDWVLARARESGPSALEEVRVGILCLESIIRRGHACGFLAALLGEDFREREQRILAAFDLVAGHTGYETLLFSALQEFCVAAALACRAAGIDPGDALPATHLTHHECYIRAARGEPRVRDLLRQQEVRFGTFGSLDRSGEYVGFGYAVGLVHDQDFESEMRAVAEERAREVETPQPQATQAFQTGLENAAQERLGLRPGLAPDEDTRLGVLLDLEQVPFERRPVVSVPEDADLVASVDLTTETPRLAGRDAELETRLVEPAIDPYAIAGYAKLGAFGLSEVRLSFRYEGQNSGTSVLLIRAQKGLRMPLPYSGDPRIDVHLDGRLVAERLSLSGSSVEDTWLPLPIPRTVAGDRHVLSIRLDETSDTTLRIWRIEVRKK